MTQATTPQRIQINEQGRVVIPAKLRHALGISAGDQLVARAENGRLILEKIEVIEQRLKARFAHIPKGRSLADELIAARRAEAAREDKL